MLSIVIYSSVLWILFFTIGDLGGVHTTTENVVVYSGWEPMPLKYQMATPNYTDLIEKCTELVVFTMYTFHSCALVVFTT